MAKQNVSISDLEAIGLVLQPDGTYRNMRNETLKVFNTTVVANPLFETRTDKPKTTSGRLEMKPMSVNVAWQGKRFKTPAYKAYEQSAMSMLKKDTIPHPPYRLTLIFGVSSQLADIDNPIKNFTDILQKFYKFNDKEIYELSVKKVLVEKRKEFCEFNLEHINV